MRCYDLNPAHKFEYPSVKGARRAGQAQPHHLTQYNPELLDKQRLLAITKCDMLDDELIEEMKSHLPEGVPSVFISSVSGLNIPRLKDMLWEALQP